MQEYVVHGLDELKAFASEFLENIVLRSDRATVVTLSGDLGAGKTALTKLFAEVLGITETVSSPTFVLERRYMLKNSSQLRLLVHIDAYRLEGGVELQRIGWTQTLKNPDTLIVLEWPEQVEDALPSDRVRITLEVVDADTRKLTVISR